MKPFFTILLLFFGLNSFAQKDTVVLNGVIMDSVHNEFLPFVDIICDTVVPTPPEFRKRSICRADIDGNFTFKLPRAIFTKKNIRIYFWYVGYEIKPVAIRPELIKEKIIVKGIPLPPNFKNEIKPIEPVKEK